MTDSDSTPDTIRLSPTQTLRVVQSTRDVLELESTWATTTNRPRTHWHPRQHEHFEVLEGNLTVDVGDALQQVLAAGETLDIPPRTPHRMWNDGPGTARAIWRVTPAQRTEEMFRRIEQGVGPITALRLIWTFRNEMRLGTPRTP